MFEVKKGFITITAAVSMIASPVTTLAESHYQNNPASTALITTNVGASHISPYATVKNGSRGADVKTLQHMLNVVMGAGLAEDSIAGSATVAAIKNYQKAEGITADGIAGANTVSAIRSYQSSRNLTVDGIAGSQTFAKLRSDANGSSTANNTNTSSLAAYVNSLVGTSAKEWGGGSGTQCVELPKYYIDQYFKTSCKNLGLGNGNTLYSGIAATYPGKFQKITYYAGFQPKVGDIISYHSSVHPDKGHAAIVIAVNGSEYTIAEQWKDSGTVRSRTVTVKAPVHGVSYTIIGVARPKQ